MSASFLPSIMVPLVGLVFPAVAMALLFIYIQREDTAGI
ncbi:MAG: photosystem I reaction center subunit VIII [Elainellaceae cyanobacterium]